MFPPPPQQMQLAGPLQSKPQMPQTQPQTLPQVQYPQLGMGMSPMGGPPAAPVAQQMAQYGRGNDSMLMHVTPSEVQGLQGLAQMQGGSLTTNPVTGLPEAGFLESMLPTILGVAGTFFGIPPMLTAAVVGAGTGMATGSLEKGLMAGLGAFGGSSLGAGLGIGGASAGAGAAGAAGATPISNVIAANPALAPATTAISPSAVSSLGANLGTGAIGGTTGATIGAGAGVLPDAARTAALQSSAYPSIATNPLTSRLGSLGTAAPAAGPQAPAFLTDILGQKMGQQAADFGTRFAEEASKNFAGAPQAKISAMKTGAAALGAAQPFLSAMEPRYAAPEAEDDESKYRGPYLPAPRTARFKPRGTEDDSSEFQYFDNVNPYPSFVSSRDFAKGGDVPAPEVRPGNLDIAPGAKETFPLPPMPEVRPGNLEIAPPNVVQPGMPFPPLPPSRFNSAPPGRVTRPLGYGDEYNYGMRGGETNYTPPPPTTPSVDETTGGGTTTTPLVGTGPGNGTVTRVNPAQFNFTQDDMDRLTRFFQTFGGPTTSAEVTQGGGGGGGGISGGSGSETPLPTNPTPPVTPTLPPAPPVVIEPPRPVNPRGGGSDVADEVSPDGGGTGGGTGVDVLPPRPTTPLAPPPVTEPYLPPPPVIETPPPVLPPAPVVEPYFPPPPPPPPPVVVEPPRPLNPRGGGFDVASEVTDTPPPPPPAVEPSLPPPPVVEPSLPPPPVTEPFLPPLPTPPVVEPSLPPPPVVEPSLPPPPMPEVRPRDLEIVPDYMYSKRASTPPVLPPAPPPVMPPVDEPYLPPPPPPVIAPPVLDPRLSETDQEIMLASPSEKRKKFAAGGSVPLDNGAFIIDARTVSELGNGSSSAGQELLARYGGMPIRGKGDGVSDSIPAKIDGRQPARVARDEVKFDPEAVRRFGGGDHALGVKRLHALMDKAHKARKGADRGEDTKLRKAMTR